MAKLMAASREVRTGLTCQQAPPVDRKSTGIRCWRARRAAHTHGSKDENCANPDTSDQRRSLARHILC